MTYDEQTIEYRVERAVDRADAAFMAGKLSEVEYNAKIDAIDDWADRMYCARHNLTLED